MAHTKAEWRVTLLAARRALSAAVRAPHSATIAARVVDQPAFHVSATLLTYVPIGAEVDPGLVAQVGRARGMDVRVPGADTTSWMPLAGVDGGAPSPGDAIVGPVFVVVPGVGFDENGGRLGRGRGFYDRALATLRATGNVAAVVGVAFECQLVSELPRDPWDERVDVVVTESRTRTIATCPAPRRGVGA